LPFKRVQFTPDLLPAGLPAASFRPAIGDVPVPTRPGIRNCCSPTRSTARRQNPVGAAGGDAAAVTVEGETFALAQPFLVIATQNPIELDGTYPLPEAQLDRFLIRLDIGYPSEQQEQEILRRRRDVRADAVPLPQLLSAQELLAMQASLEDVFVELRSSATS
jgi:MoxR-like ATPase